MESLRNLRPKLNQKYSLWQNKFTEIENLVRLENISEKWKISNKTVICWFPIS